MQVTKLLMDDWFILIIIDLILLTIYRNIFHFLFQTYPRALNLVFVLHLVSNKT